ncbi:MAG: Deaminated glutathione amidase [Gammaproteobacteria bacterium]|nr:Deaminated glutathione amidase [Gammaproteobacteria bacterium]
MTRIAAVQMNSSADQASNLEVAAELIDAARQQGASFVVLPENFSVMPAREKDRPSFAEHCGDGPVQLFLSDQARLHGVWIVGGTAPIRAAADDARIKATCLMFDDRGRRVARYHKIHLFDVRVSDTESYRESDAFEPGAVDDDNLICVDTPVGRVGLSVCYDMRFPELYRRLVDEGAEIVTVPSAFTATTGRAHWEPLLRARAIENQIYIVAPAQWGDHASGRQTHGHTMIIDPWGRILAQQSTGNDVIVADIDLRQLKNIRKEFPALSHRRLGRRACSNLAETRLGRSS